MPIVVIGGGLTAVDAATEALAYYPVQVERYSKQFEQFSALQRELFLANLTAEDRVIHEEFLAHALALSERPASDVLNELGGASLIYRRAVLQSPAFRLNREELTKALAEGIKIIENTSPVSYSLDEWQAIQSITLHDEDGQATLACRTVLYAIGTQPNDIIFNEDISFRRQPVGFQLGNIPDGRWVSRVGDLHPDYVGSVVKAMASAKAAAPLIDQAVQSWSGASQSSAAVPSFQNLTSRLALEHSAVVTRVTHHGPNITEIFIHAPAAARQFAPGQFFRLQSLEDDSIEPLAMTGASVDIEKGELSMVILSMGSSSLRSTHWQVGTKISLMGPTGTPTLIANHRKVVLVGGGLGNAVLFSIGKAMRESACEVVYFAGYKTQADIFTPERIHAAAQTVVWCCDESLPSIASVSSSDQRQSDSFFHGNVVQALLKHKHLLADAEHLLVIGSDRMMAAVADARKNPENIELNKIPVAIASINSPMQCMMKAVCGQCLQLHRNRDTGAVSYVFSCLAQDQSIDEVDFSALHQRLGQNRLLETISFATEKAHG
jgi:NAD(P)H-flavin reductase